MRFTLLPIFAALASFAAAQGPNAFNIPSGGFTGFAAGKSETLSWSNPQGSTVTLVLRSGPSGDLGSGQTIVSHYPNKGSYTWQVPSNIVAGSDYAIEIIDDDDPNLNNFTPQFSISSPNTASASASSAASTSSGSSSSSSGSSSSATSASSSSSSGSSSASSTTTGSSTTSTPANSSSTPSSNPAPVIQVGGSLLAVAVGFAVAL